MRLTAGDLQRCAALSGVLLLILGGCAAKPSVSEYQCQAGDWQTIGYRDGAAGVASTRLLAHQEACGAYGIVPERSQYMLGWEDGLATYCTADNGFLLGQRGAAVNTLCSGELREPFATAHADGLALHQAQQRVNSLHRQINSSEARLPEIKQEMLGATTAQLAPDLTAEERIALVAKLDSLAQEKADILSALPGLRLELRQAEYELDELQQSIASIDY